MGTFARMVGHMESFGSSSALFYVLEYCGVDSRHFVPSYFGFIPSDVYNLIIFINGVDWHRHVIISRNDLINLVSNQQISVQLALQGNFLPLESLR